MPGMISHFICGERAIAELKGYYKSEILAHRQLFNIGTQGPDIFFYYIPALLNKNTKKTGSVLHEESVGLYIKSMLDIADTLKGDELKSVKAYICGYITHYCLDCVAHPYVYYKTGHEKDKGRIEMLKQLMNHRNLETNIDVSILKIINSQRPAQKKLSHIIKVDKNDADAVSYMVSTSLNKVYGIEMTPRQIYKAMSYMKRITWLLQSKTGKRKRLLGFIEDKTIGVRLYSALIHSQELESGKDFLNLKKSFWFKPGYEKDKLNHSFMELFFDAVNESSYLIDMIMEYFDGLVTKEELLNCIGNRSLHSGFECN